MRISKICLLIALATALLVSGSTQVLAQSRITVKGKVSSSDNQPLEGVSVRVKGSSQGTATDKNGQYSINVDNNKAVLVFSSIGYANREETVGNRSTLNVSLTAEAKESEEVVVIGYQTVRRKNLLASVSSVSAKDLKDIPINSAGEALNGRLAGVTATTAEGSPDAQIRIRVRGGGSITQDNSPLYIIDGVQAENGLAALSPQDIQSIDVLKDASATAIYGARGANGVIVITTKSGRPGKLQVSYNGFLGVKNLRKELDVMDPYNFVLYEWERSRNNTTDSTSFANRYGTTFDTLSVYKKSSPVDWQKEVMGRTGLTQTHNVSIGGGNSKTTYNLSYSHNDDKAIVRNSTYKRDLLNFKFEQKFTKWIKFGASLRYNHQDVFGAGTSDDRGTSFNRLRNAVKYRPFLMGNQTIYDKDVFADPNVGNGLILINPIQLADAEYRKKTTEVFNATGYLDVTITKNLSFRSTVGYDRSHYVDRQFADTLAPLSIQNGQKPIISLDTVNRTTITNSNVFNWSVRGLKGKHDVSVLLGEETYQLINETHSQQYKGFPTFTAPDAAFHQLSLGTSVAGYPKFVKTKYTNVSFFGRVNYSFLNKYLLSFNMRADGASKFGDGHKWGYFPGGSVAWRVKNENFMKNVHFISDLKLRAGYGTVGNNRIDDYLYLTTFRNDQYYYGINGQLVPAFSSTALVNTNLKWETTISRNLGLDISLFNGRLDMSVDIYHNSTRDLLLLVPIASSYGYASQLQNIGKTSNKGVEIQLTGTVMQKKDFRWTSNFNISFNKNRVEALGVNQQYYYPGASWGVSGQPADYIVRIGDPVGSMWGFVNDGFYNVSDFDYNAATRVYTLKTGVVSDAGIIGAVQPGSIKFKDLNGDGVVDLTNDRKVIGNATPKFTGGLNQQFSYKRWDASLFLNFSVGNDVYDANKIEFANGYTPGSNLLAIMQNRWKTIDANGNLTQYVNSSGQVIGIAPDQMAALNANATIWQPIRAGGAFFPNSWAIEDGSFLRLNNVTVGYSFPAQHIGKLKMSKLRVYVTGNNLAVLTGYSGYDPEVSVRNSGVTPGLDYSAYPKSWSLIFGLNATF